MKRRIRTTVISLIILTLAEISIILSVQANKIDNFDSSKQIIIVDQSGEGNYKTIQEAVNNAQPGSTIYVKKGNYKEVIMIKKEIRLVGEEKYSTLINPISEKNKYAICLGASKIRIENLSINNGAPGLYSSGIRVISSNNEILNCNIFDIPIGIVVWSSENLIDGCHFWNCEDEGIALIGTQYSKCNNNIITNCIFQDNCDGIELQYSSGNSISNCDFYDNTHTGIDAIASSNDNNVIFNCRIYNNKVNGIYFSSSSENMIKNCLIFNNEDGNIVINKESNNNYLISNFESNHQQYKLRIIDFFKYVLNNRFSQNLRNRLSMLKSFIAF